MPGVNGHTNGVNRTSGKGDGPIKIGVISACQGDRIDSLLQMLSGPIEVDAIVGDYLAELNLAWLESISIYRAIDAYNHNKDLVDNTDQLRARFTVHISQEKRIWRPLFYYLLDISFCNSYLI
jgi:hypothetical protein